MTLGWRFPVFLLFTIAFCVNGLGQAPLSLPAPVPIATPTTTLGQATEPVSATPTAVPPITAPVAAPIALSQSIFLDVKDLGTNLASNKNWATAWGSYSKNTTRARALEINLRNPAKIPGEYVVNWYFFAVPVRGGQRFLFDKDERSITISPGGSEKATVVSDELQSRSVRYGYDYYYSASYKSGTKPEGWIVTVSIGGKVVRIKTSSAQMDALYKNTNEFTAMQQEVKSQRSN